MRGMRGRRAWRRGGETDFLWLVKSGCVRQRTSAFDLSESCGLRKRTKNAGRERPSERGKGVAI